MEKLGMETMRHNEACIYFHIVLTTLLGHREKQAVLEGTPASRYI